MPLVARACDFSGGRFKVQQVAANLANGKYRLWASMELPAQLQAVGVSTIFEHESGMKTFDIMLLGGPKREQFLRFVDDFLDQAAASDCAKAVLHGQGWCKEVLPREWRVAAVLYECNLEKDSDGRPDQN